MAGPQNPGTPPDLPLDPEIKATLTRAFIVPAPPFNKIVTVPFNREERLRAIIKNVEAHNEKVRANIISAPPPPSANAPPPPLTPSTRLALLARQERINASLITSLSTPWDPASGSPAIKTTPYRAPPPAPSQSQSQSQSPDGTARRQLPPQVVTAYHKMRALDAYDAHAEKGLEYYRRALERRGSVPGVGAAAGGAAGGGGRRASDSGGGGARGDV
ncbi:uncharacterized protein K441DRAFT_695478 [Cenococcum geophilum 1.58]|uniref:uncharacterized protein n=1 Tax=Cenococcum geophilum 1.58 TaxID=794803 RepID=UPI00358F87EF|nr:hypothetical protein K441DRAFT_695478 [Cenococcum geophilum 1.58]